MPANVMVVGGPGSSGDPLGGISAEAMARVQALYDRALYLQAYREAEAIRPLRQWGGTTARTLAGRIAANVGAYGMAHVQHWLAWRSNKTDANLVTFHGHGLLERRGPVAALEFLDRFEVPSAAETTPEGMAYLYSLRATLLAHLRDFPASEHWLERATALRADGPWVWTCRAHVLELQDRYHEALKAAQRSLELHPWYRAGVQSVGHGLQLLDRDEEALQFLTEASKHLESMHVMRQLALLQTELGLYAEAAASIDRLEELGPLIGKAERSWLQRQRIALNCLKGNRPAALEAAQKIDEPPYQELAERLRNEQSYRQVILPVVFVRQHHMTCVPATLATISLFWNKPAEHLEVAEAICYDGTPAHSERMWAETHGWVAREFTLSWEAARALLDRGMPFTLITSNATSSHAQAVVGYDELRQTLWIRDPFVYYRSEFLIKGVLEVNRSRGPRCMVLVPADRRELLEGIDLPDAALYDQLYGVEAALAAHRRAEALRISQEMEKAAPEHRLSLYSRRALAAYDGNTPAMLQVFELLLKQFPEDEGLLLAKVQCLGELARRKERLDMLEGICTGKRCDPVFWQQYAQELQLDAREQAAAASWILWARRYQPNNPAVLNAWANQLMERRDFANATRYYRFAACLGEANETFARSFFSAACHSRQTEAALDFLRARDARLGRLAAYPSITLVECLQHLHRTGEALAALDSALARRPSDGQLHLFAADFYARLSRFETARKLIREVEPHCSPVAWHRGAAAAAGYENQKTEALLHWREVLKLEPLAHDAIQAVALLLAETQGREPAIQFLDDLCANFPFSCPLLTLRIQWLAEDGPTAVIPRLRELLEVNPADSWAWRILALQLAETGATAEALTAAEEAIRLEPNRSPGFASRGKVLQQVGRVKEARADFHEALRLEVDNEVAMARFVDTAPSLAERKEALGIVAEELRRQVIFQNALFAYQDTARGLLAPAEVLALLQEAHRARPDLWQAWSVLVHQLIDLQDYEAALKLAREATERFPLHPALWADLARVEKGRLDDTAQIAALERALELKAGYAFASRELADIYRKQQKFADARRLLEEAILVNPLDALNHGCLAQTLWDLGERESAIASAKHALGLIPEYPWAWNALLNWGPEVSRPQLAVETARELAALRAGDPGSWLRLADCLDPETQADELFAAIEKALSLNPRCEEAYDIRARALSRLNRCDEALEQCRPPALQPTPVSLLIRAALIEAERGNLAKAVAVGAAVVSEHPDHFGGWKLLSELQLRAGNVAEAMKAAEQMAALAPLDPVPLGYLGDLKLQMNDRQGAASVFQRAFKLDPFYEYAGVKLFHLQLERQSLDAAQETLRLLQARGETEQALACQVELAAARSSETDAVNLFRKLCQRQGVEEWSVAVAAAALEKERYGDGALNRTLKKCVGEKPCQPAVAAYWVQRQVQRRRWWLHSRLAGLEGETQRRAVVRYLEKLGDALHGVREKRDITGTFRFYVNFWRIRARHGEWLRNDVEGWGKVGYVLTTMGRPRAVIKWLRDWKSRPQAESWMLFNLILMLHRLGRYAESLEVIRHVVAMRHGDEFYEQVRVWAAFEEALTGNLGEARQHLQNLPEKGKPELALVRSMTELLLSVHEPGPKDPKEARKEVRLALRKMFGGRHPFQVDKYARDGYRRLMKALAGQTGSQNLWGWWFYRGWHWFLLGAATLCVPFAVFLLSLKVYGLA